MKINLYLSYMYNYLAQKMSVLDPRNYYKNYYSHDKEGTNNVTLTQNIKNCYNWLLRRNNHSQDEDNIMISHSNDKLAIINQEFEMVVPQKPILDIYLECEKNTTHILVNLKDNIYNIDKKMPLYAAIKILENIDIEKFKHIKVKYIGQTKTYILNIDLKLEHVIEI